MVRLNRVYTYKDMCIDLEKIDVKKFVYGYSVQGRKLWAAVVGEGDLKLICTAGIHGRESINTIILIKMIEDYAKEKNGKILFVPMANPDGYEIAREKIEWKYNANGVDINRNFPSKTWTKKSVNDKPASEAETKALMELFNKYKADIYIDFHSRGECIYHYRSVMDNVYNKKQFDIANILSQKTGYRVADNDEECPQNDSGGNTVHYYSEYLKGNAITIETVNEKEKFPLNIKLQSKVYDKIRCVPETLLKYA